MHYRGPYWLMGLPFDAINMDAAIERIHAAATSQSRLLFVTPNVNFVVMARSDARFRDTVLRSQLSIVDGMPLVWLGRKVGIPFTERVAGSSLLERLTRDDRRPLRIFLFGGPPDAARLAAGRLPSLGRGLVPVGHYTPGFGSIESMSTPEVIDSINGSKADFLLVALGAKKGHEWIAQNLHRLHTPVISHLGACINFLAGTIPRAPGWVQSIGCEWAWRILQEPALARRYWDDGRHFIPAALATGGGKHAAGLPGELGIQADTTKGVRAWTLGGALTGTTAPTLVSAFDTALARNEAPALLDVSQLLDIDAAGFGLLYALLYRYPGTPPAIACNSAAVRQKFHACGAEVLLGI